MYNVINMCEQNAKIIDIIKRLHNIQDTVMVGDIITSYIDDIADQLQHPIEMEDHVAIIYHVIDANTRPGGRLSGNSSTTVDSRPEQRQIGLSDTA